MHSFRVDEVGPEAFVERVRDALSRRRFDDIATVWLRGSELLVRFRRLGTTTLRFLVHPQPDGGFRADYAGADVAALHAPFAAAFEERFEDLLAGVGARLATD